MFLDEAKNWKRNGHHLHFCAEAYPKKKKRVERGEEEEEERRREGERGGGVGEGDSLVVL